MKAGRTGSTPGDVTKVLSPESDALRVLRKDIGGASFLLNTIVVGLDAVEKGHQKPDEINVMWAPKDRIVAARKARKFTVEAFIVRAAETLKSYQNTVSKLPQFKPVTDNWSYKTRAADKLADICKTTIGTKNYLTAAGKLLITWRNKISHNQALTVNKLDENVLRDNAEEILQRYSLLDIDRLLVHMKEGRPTLKDVSSLISMAINLAIEIDRNVYNSLTKEDVFSLAEQYGIIANIKAIRLETTELKIVGSVKRAFNSRAPNLYSPFLRFYESDGSDLELFDS